MVVPLLALPEAAAPAERASQAGVAVRRARPWHLSATRGFIAAEFGARWADEASVALGRQPSACFLAWQGERVCGFAVYDAAFRGVFGPIGVRADLRGKGAGAALLLRALWDMRVAGYLYAIIGAAGPAEFYRKVCGALALPADWPDYAHTPD